MALYFHRFRRRASRTNAHENAATAYLAAGVGLAVLDGFVRQLRRAHGASVALAAAASAKLLRLREDDAALRDATHLAVSDTAGPAGQLHRLWRNLATAEPDLGAEGSGRRAVDRGLERSMRSGFNGARGGLSRRPGDGRCTSCDRRI